MGYEDSEAMWLQVLVSWPGRRFDYAKGVSGHTGEGDSREAKFDKEKDLTGRSHRLKQITGSFLGEPWSDTGVGSVDRGVCDSNQTQSETDLSHPPPHHISATSPIYPNPTLSLAGCSPYRHFRMQEGARHGQVSSPAAQPSRRRDEKDAVAGPAIWMLSI